MAAWIKLNSLTSNIVCQCLQVKQVEPLTLYPAPFTLLNITVLFYFSVMGLNISTLVISAVYRCHSLGGDHVSVIAY